MNPEFTRDLNERDQIFRSAVILERAVFDVSKTLYIPPDLEDISPSSFTAVTTPSSATVFDTPLSFKFQSIFVGYNLRLAEIALAIDPVIESALCNAGLSDVERTFWAAHRDVAEKVTSAPEQPPEDSNLLFVPDLNTFAVPCGKTRAYTPAEEKLFAGRLQTASKLILRLAYCLERVMQTVDRRAVSRRAYVAEDRLIIDGVPYEGLTNYSLRFFKHVARAGGYYVSSAAIAGDAKSLKISPKGQFRTKRVTDDVSMKHPELLPLFEIVPGVGNRLILPLPPER